MERRDFITVAVAAAAIGAASQAQAQGAGGASMHPPKYKALEDPVAAASRPAMIVSGTAWACCP